MRQLFRVFIPGNLVGLILSEISLIFLCYLAGSWLVGLLLNPYMVLNTFIFDEGGLIQILLVVGCLTLGLYFQNLYTNVRIKSVTLLVQQICLVIGLAFLIQALFAYARRPEWSLPRWAMIFGSILALFVIPGWRLLYSRVILKAIGFQRVLFLGVAQVSQEIAAHLVARPEIGMSVLGYIDDIDEDEELAGGRMIGRVEDLTRIAQTLKPDLIVVGMTERRRELPMSEMLRLRFAGVRFEEAAVTFEAAFGRVSTRQMHPSRLVFSSDLGPRKGSLFWHSLYSLPIAALILILFAPVMVIVAIVVKLTSPGPVLHRQERVGLNGSVFTLYKFRSMYVDAEARSGPVWATKGDPRVTPPGKWIRRFRLDELPQLLNVLRNEMALVGPRPERPQFVESLAAQIPYYSYRHCVRPGITGWAQINYKYGDTLDDAIMKLEYDLYYIKNLAVSLDMYIIFHTLKVMLFSETAQ
jgi:sugar transferase (PEP-CTERM system associated)